MAQRSSAYGDPDWYQPSATHTLRDASVAASWELIEAGDADRGLAIAEEAVAASLEDLALPR